MGRRRFTEMRSTNSERKGPAKRPRLAGFSTAWKWVVAAFVAAIVVWQVAQGVFVKSASISGGVSFFPPQQTDAGSATNRIDQPSGSHNEATIRGGEGNTIEQRGSHNKATIGGDP
jgi:hypothetical protein